jgi:hypothetical protein
MPIRIVRIGARTYRRCTHVLRKDRCWPKDTDLKNRPRMPSAGSERPSFPNFWDFPLNERRCQFILHARICAHAALKERAEDSLWRSKIPVLLPILRYPRFRAHDAHAFTQRRRTSYWPALKNPFLRAQDAFFRPLLRFSAFQSELLQSVTQFSLPAHAARIMMRKSAATRIRACVRHFRI